MLGPFRRWSEVFKNRKVYISAIAKREGLVSLNGRPITNRSDIELKVGSRFSLLGRVDCFNFVLFPLSRCAQVMNLLESHIVCHLVPTDVGIDPHVVVDNKRAIEEPNAEVPPYDCPICYVTMASGCTLFPCGCNFCYQCIEVLVLC